MANAAADARGTSCANNTGNKGMVSSNSSGFPITSSRSGIPMVSSSNSNYLNNMNRGNAQLGNPAFQDLPLHSHPDEAEEHHHHSIPPQQQRCGSLEDCSVLGNRTPPPPPPPASGKLYLICQRRFSSIIVNFGKLIIHFIDDTTSNIIYLQQMAVTTFLLT